MKFHSLRPLLSLAILLTSLLASADTIATLNDTTLSPRQSLTFQCRLPFNLSAKFNFAPSESSFGKSVKLFDIIAANDTFSVSEGIQSIGTFEPSPFLQISHNNQSAQVSQADRLIKSGNLVTVRLSATLTSGLRLFVNGNAIDLDAPSDSISEVSIKADRNISFSSIILQSSADASQSYPALSINQILNRLSSTPIPPAGLYTSLDRENDPQLAIPGGAYKLAVLPDSISDGYDIIYLGGATVNSDAWQPGMIKGKLTPTIFYNHYDLIWYDANHQPIAGEIFCNFIDGSIMQLNFPLYSTKMRFSRLNGSADSLIRSHSPVQ